MDIAPLSTLTDTERVENVVIFLCDNLRLDYLPAEIKQLGVWGPMIAPGTSTYESMPSFTSGLYPSEHGVNQKLLEHGSASLDEEPLLLAANKNVGINSETSWITKPSHEKPVLETNHVREESILSEMEPPFVYIEHDKGAHSPYGVPFEEQEDDHSFWANKTVSQLRQCYERGVRHSTARFISRIEYLQSKNLLEETLVVFLSDHGELLGEPEYGGFFGHKTPIVPEIVEVPLAFIGAGLPEGEMFETVVSGIDVPPTTLTNSTTLFTVQTSGTGAPTTTGASTRRRDNRSSWTLHRREPNSTTQYLSGIRRAATSTIGTHSSFASSHVSMGG
jgi:hypothetical protein